MKLRDFGGHFGNKRLTGIARIDGHHRDLIEQMQIVLDALNRRGGIKHHPHLFPRLAKHIDDPKSFAADGFRMQGNGVCSGFYQRRDKRGGLFDHQVDIDGKRRIGPNLRHKAGR